MKHLATWLVFTEIVLVAWFAIAVISVLVYAPFWLLGGLSEKRRRPAERAIRWWPLIAVLSLIAVVLIVLLNNNDLIARMGNLTIWSAAFFLATVLFGVASVAGVVALWRAPQEGVRKGVRRFSVFVIVGIFIAAAYLLYWGFIGLRPWA